MQTEKTTHDECVASGGAGLTILRDRFVFDRESGKFYLLSAEGTTILRAILAGRKDADIETELTSRYRITRGTAMRDLEQFRLKLIRLGLIPASKEN